MSSYYSSVTVLSSEWERMQQEVASANAYQIQSNQEIARLQRLERERRQELSRIQEASRQTVGRATDFINISFQNNLDQLTENVRTMLGSQPEGFNAQLESLRAQSARIDARITAASATIESIARRYNEVFQSLMDSIGQAQTRAESILAELDRFIERIERLNPERFAAGEYSALILQRANVSGNISSGDYQAALMASQDGILNASRLLTRLIALNEQYHALYADAAERLNTLQGRIDTLTSPEGVIALDVCDEPMEFDYDINYWSHGIFDEISAAVAGIRERLERGARSPLSLSEMDSIVQQINALDNQLTRCDNEARRDLASAITVDNAVSRLHNGLENRGWTLEESGRVDDDNRKPYSLVYGDGGGNTISFVIAAGTDPDKPAFFCEAFAEDKPTAEIIKEGIGAALESEGLQARNTVRRNDCSANSSPDAFINNIVKETDQIAAARMDQIRDSIGL